MILRLRCDKQPRMLADALPLPRALIDRIADVRSTGLQLEDPQLALRQAQEALELAEKNLAWGKEHLPVIEGASDCRPIALRRSTRVPRQRNMPKHARRAERAATFLKAEMNLLEAHQQLGDALRPPRTQWLRRTGQMRSFNRLEQICLTARRLVERGNRFVPDDSLVMQPLAIG